MKRIFTISGLVLFCFFFINTAFAQNITVKGKVTDAATGESLIGVSVQVKGTTTGTQTDVNGAYSVAAPSTATLAFTYIGYATQNVTVNGRNVINISLVAQANELQQVVVIGYGTQRKVDNTGAVATVKGGEISKQAATNALSALQGKVAGVEIINNGQPGSSPTIDIRGVGTIFGSTKPLFVVDGVFTDDVSYLNNADIENVNVLKDGSSTSIFGVRGANGVIIITTKRGKTGKATITYNGSAGWQTATNQVKMANGTQYAMAINELTVAGGNAAPFANPTDFGTGTDWFSQILRSAFVTNHQVSLSGGTDKYTYNASFGYLNQDGIVKTNNYQRYTIHFANDFKVTKDFKVGLTANLLSSNSKDIDGGIFRQMYSAAPIVPVFYANGKYGDANDYQLGTGPGANPQATLDFFNQKSTNKRITGDVYGEYQIIKGLKFKTDFNADLGLAEQRHYIPVYFATLTQQSSVSSLDLNHTNTRNWAWDNTLTYDKTIEKHKFTALLGYSAYHNATYFADAIAQNVPDATTGNLHTSFPAGATVVYTDNTSAANADRSPQTNQLSQFARINYSYNDRYLLNASIRHDGGSQFAILNPTSTQKYNDGYVWLKAIGVGWVVTNEDFMKGQNIFSSLKLRGSYGEVGNGNIPKNVTIQVVNQDPGTLTYVFGNPPVTGQGRSITTLVPNQDSWEVAHSTDFGIEGALFRDQLSFEAEYYNRLTTNAIFPVAILTSDGLGGSENANQADIRNRGFEFVLNWKQRLNKDWSYSVGANLGINDNVVTKVLAGSIPIYGGGNGITNGALATRTIQGDPIGEFYGYKVIGIFQNQIQLNKYPQLGTEHVGDFMYQSFSGAGAGGQITSNDRVRLGNPNAKYGYGINTKVNYKNWDLALDFQGRADVSIYNANLANRFGNENFTEDFFTNRWYAAGSSNYYPSVNIGSNTNAQPNSFYVSSGAYFRIRTAQLGYSIPAEGLKRYGIQSIRIYADAQNPVTIFGYKGFTPEVGGSFPNAGIDANVYPLYATYNFGVNVTF
ncbi:MAG: SusC/RagA family TonB-linked outer membrane protein [Sphingobacteriales bacterium]